MSACLRYEEKPNGMTANSNPIQQALDLPTQERLPQDETNARLASATGILALGNIASRVLGLIREKSFAYLFGATASMDAFQIAVIIPKTFYDLLIGGHVNGAIVPVLSEIVTLKGRDEFWKVVNILVTLLTLLVTGLILLIYLFAPQIIHLTASGYDSEIQDFAIQLLRITAPALLFLSLFAVLSGALYALKNFKWAALAGAMFNASIVLGTFLLAPPQSYGVPLEANLLMPLRLTRPEYAVQAAAIGWFIGAIAQLALQIPGIDFKKIRISFDWRHPALKSIALLYAPVMFSLLMDTLVIRFFSYRLASESGVSGAISYMNYATTLIQFPQGLVATAISLAILPTLAAQAVLVRGEGMRPFRDTLGLGLRLTTTLIIPATIGLYILAQPIIMLLFEGGQFTAANTAITSHALSLYLIGLPFAAIDLLLVYAFYARKDTLTPALIGVFSHLVYMGTVVLTLEHFSFYSLMIADSVKHIVHTLLSVVLLRRHIEGFGDQHLLSNAFKTLFAASAMGLVGFYILPYCIAWLGMANNLHQMLVLVLAGSIMGFVYLSLASLLRIQELAWLYGLLRKRLRP